MRTLVTDQELLEAEHQPGDEIYRDVFAEGVRDRENGLAIEDKALPADENIRRSWLEGYRGSGVLRPSDVPHPIPVKKWTECMEVISFSIPKDPIPPLVTEAEIEEYDRKNAPPAPRPTTAWWNNILKKMFG